MLAILLCCKDGENFIIDQLNSIINQEFKDFDIYIKDNFSSDSTYELIKRFINQNPQIKIFFLQGDRNHFANSYIKGLGDIPKKYKYYAFCDQDDIWESNHLSRSLNYLGNIDNEVPSVYCSRTKLINENGEIIGFSSYFPKKPHFKNALVQSIAGANTMIFNYSAYEFLMKLDLNKKIISHDWMLYILVTYNDGNFFYDHNPTVRYRQHNNNLVGANIGLYNSLVRLNLMLKGKFRQYNISNMQHVKSFDKNNSSNKNTLDAFFNSIFSPKGNRLYYLIKSGVYRQSLLGNIALFVNIFFDGND